MSRTRRFDLHKLGRRLWLRRPRGAKIAKILGLRSVPPDAWDDINVGREAVKQAERKEHQRED